MLVTMKHVLRILKRLAFTMPYTPVASRPDVLPDRPS
jgi:hypothetical protein